MFEDLIKKIYELRYEAIVTPQNLFENALLDNYDYVKYYKSDNACGLCVEMKCRCEDLIPRVFIYTFDERNWLQKIEIKEYVLIVVFDRTKNLNKVMREYISNRDANINALAV